MFLVFYSDGEENYVKAVFSCRQNAEIYADREPDLHVEEWTIDEHIDELSRELWYKVYIPQGCSSPEELHLINIDNPHEDVIDEWEHRHGIEYSFDVKALTMTQARQLAFKRYQSMTAGDTQGFRMVKHPYKPGENRVADWAEDVAEMIYF